MCDRTTARATGESDGVLAGKTTLVLGDLDLGGDRRNALAHLAIDGVHIATVGDAQVEDRLGDVRDDRLAAIRVAGAEPVDVEGGGVQHRLDRGLGIVGLERLGPCGSGELRVEVPGLDQGGDQWFVLRRDVDLESRHQGALPLIGQSRYGADHRPSRIGEHDSRARVMRSLHRPAPITAPADELPRQDPLHPEVDRARPVRHPTEIEIERSVRFESVPMGVHHAAEMRASKLLLAVEQESH